MTSPIDCGLLFGAAVAACLATGSAQGNAAVLSERHGNLEGAWLFRTDLQALGEKQGWHTPELDETGWRTLRVPGYWEPQGITDPRPGQPPKPKNGLPWTDYDGVAWYRLRFVVPAEWRGRPLALRLGSVDDEDRTFLNGMLVGETGPGVERPVVVQRVYDVPADAVRFGAQNVLALRVSDGGGPGGLVGPLVSLLPKRILEAPMKLPPNDRPLAERFADPPAESRILKIVHSLPDAPQQQDSFLRSLIAQGFGGMATNVSFDGYVESEEKWAAFVSAVRKAKALGMSLWLYDEKGYPSGTAGGLTLRDHPEWEARGLLVAEAFSEGGRVTLALPPGKLVTAAAFPRVESGIDLDGQVDLAAHVGAGKLTWEAPAGRWHAMVFTEGPLYEGTHAEVSLADNRPYLNLLMPEPTKRFLEVTHDRYAQRLGGDLGEHFVSTFTDEPSLMSRFFRPLPYRPLPWAPNLPTEFEKRRGYALGPVLPALIADCEGSAKARYDFWLTVGELVSENYFGQLERWCDAHNLGSGGHLLLEEPLCDHVPFYGDFFRCARRLSAPSIDCLTSIPAQVPWRIARMISSAAELNGDTVTMCETSDHVQRYRREGDERPVVHVTEEQIRGTCNRLMLNGINTITSYYSFAGLNAAQVRRLNEHVGRCCTMLRGGRQVTDIAVVYPIESLWTRFRPARSGATDSAVATKVEGVFNSVSDSLFQARRDFTYLDSRTLTEGRVEGGALKHRDLSWRVLVLPSADTLPWAAWQNLARFWRQGGVVVSLSALPANSESKFPDTRVTAIARELFGVGEGPHMHANGAGGLGVFLPDGAGSLLPLVLDGVLERDVSTTDPHSPLRATHRRIDDHEVYFLINDSGEPHSESVTLCADGEGELWDPATGEATPLPDAQGLDLELPPHGGVFLRFARSRQPKRTTPAGAGLPGLSLSTLPGVEPVVGKGEFVREEVTREDDPQQPGTPRWRTTGTLTKSDVDTFLFLAFDYAEPLDLSDAHCLVLNTWVPNGQQTPAQLLVLVDEKDGGTFLAHTGRPLAAGGHVRSFVPASRFSLAGWSKDADGQLDWSKVASVKVGWGGYLGTQGETVELSVGLPEVATVDAGDGV